MNHPLPIPDMVFLTLALLSMITLTLAGYLLGPKQRRWGLPTDLMIFAMRPYS